MKVVKTRPGVFLNLFEGEAATTKMSRVVKDRQQHPCLCNVKSTVYGYSIQVFIPLFIPRHDIYEVKVQVLYTNSVSFYQIISILVLYSTPLIPPYNINGNSCI